MASQVKLSCLVFADVCSADRHVAGIVTVPAIDGQEVLECVCFVCY